jgi:hypothetical protein
MRIVTVTEAKFGKRPCRYQFKTALTQCEGKDIVGCVPTGAGKTLVAQGDGKDKMSFVVIPLSLLGKPSWSNWSRMDGI